MINTFNLDISPLIWMTEWYQYQGRDSDTENYLSVWHQTHYDVTDQNNNINCEGLATPIGFAVILAMSVLTFTTADIL